MSEQTIVKKQKKPVKARHIVLFSIAIVLLVGSLAAFLAAVIGWSGYVFGELDAMEPGQELIPGGYAFAFMGLVFGWIYIIFIMTVLLAVCWVIGLVLSVILAFFMRKKPLWLSILSCILFAIYVILVICILIPVVPGLLILLFLILFG